MGSNGDPIVPTALEMEAIRQRCYSQAGRRSPNHSDMQGTQNSYDTDLKKQKARDKFMTF